MSASLATIERRRSIAVPRLLLFTSPLLHPIFRHTSFSGIEGGRRRRTARFQGTAQLLAYGANSVVGRLESVVRALRDFPVDDFLEALTANPLWVGLFRVRVVCPGRAVNSAQRLPWLQWRSRFAHRRHQIVCHLSPRLLGSTAPRWRLQILAIDRPGCQENSLSPQTSPVLCCPNHHNKEVFDAGTFQESR